MPVVLITSLVVLIAGAALFLRHRAGRRALYRQLVERRNEVVDGLDVELHLPAAIEQLRGGFSADHITRIPDLLGSDALDRLRAESEGCLHLAERSHLPGHKKGGTLSYEAIHRHAPGCLAFYHSPQLRELLSGIVGEPVWPTADHDQSSCSILYYDRPGDHIGWHYDYNFYRGRHFTVLLSLVNRSAGGGISDGRLAERRRGGWLVEWDTSENVLVMFEGARVFHRASPVGDGDRRIMLSMTFATDPRVHPLKDLARRIKDTAYYGPRALVD